MASDPTRQPGTGLYRNWLSYIGVLTVLASVILIVGSSIADLSIRQPSPYHGIFTYMLFPSAAFAGVILFLYGMRRESVRRRKARSIEALPYPSLDLNDPRQRRRFAWMLVGGSVLFVVIAFAGYNAFLFSESTTFCGKVCHKVMEPEHVAWMNGPHARVPCVECHVGNGVSWFVKSKVSGLQQVWAVTLGDYERPIPVPIKNLRPARDTCEECHWPEKFFGAQLQQNPHFRYDEKNTAEQVSLLVKTGGGSPTLGSKAGIHWNMVIANEVTFAARDEKLQDIPWVSVRHADGSITEYVDRKSGLTQAGIEALPRRVLDCMDCHNRPSHVFVPPDTAVDRAAEAGGIPATLPWIKKVAVDALVREYPGRDQAHEGIRDAVLGFYREGYPDVARGRTRDLETAVATISSVYDRSVFPDMNVNWRTYGSNVGHRNWPGCFRCHAGDHVTKDGKVLGSECTLCHTMPQRGPLMPLGSLPPVSSENWHPWELKGKHARIRCDRCHEAGFRAPSDCAECHRLDRKAPMMSEGCDSCHTSPQQVKPLTGCKDCHDSLKGLHDKGGHPNADCGKCHKPHGWKTSGRETCLACHEGYEGHKGGGQCGGCHAF